MPEPLEITDPVAARAFASAKPRSILMALMREPRSLKGLHVELGLSPSLLHYHVTKLRRLGLIHVTRSEARAGRPIAIYGATASSFAVPTHLIEPGAELRTHLHEALARDGVRRPSSAVIYDLADDRTPRMRRVGAQRISGAGEWWSRLRLTERDAVELTGELRKMIARYGDASGSAGKSYLLHLALVRS